MKIFKNTAGFSLVEMVVYLGISAIVMIFVASFYFTIIQAKSKINGMAAVEEQGAAAIAYVTQAIRNASTVNSPVLGNSANSLSLSMASTTLNPTVFSLSGFDFMVTEGGGSPVNLTYLPVRVTELNFVNVGYTGARGAVKIKITLENINTDGRVEKKYEKTFYATASLR